MARIGIGVVLLGVVFAAFGSTATAQSARKHSTSTTSYRAPVETASEAEEAPVRQRTRTATYVNSLGKTVQTVRVHASGRGFDLITPVTYDELGRQVKSLLGYEASGTDGSFVEGAVDAQSDFYRDTPPEGRPATEHPYSETQLEASPLERVERQGAPGSAWQLGSGHTVRTDHGTNAAGMVPQFGVASDGDLVYRGMYPAGSLAKTTTTDPNGNVTMTYADRSGNEVTKEAATEGTPVLTHYVYDRFDRLRYVLPPKADSAWVAAGMTDAALQQVVTNWATRYEHDGQGREVAKYLPEEEVVTTVYDRLGRVVLRQDGLMRANDDWLFTKYDRHGRTVMTGIYHETDPTRATDRAAMQAHVRSQSAPFHERRAASSDPSPLYGYTNQVFPTENLTVWTITDYDTYDFDGDGTPDASFDGGDFPTSGGPVSTSTGTVHVDDFAAFDRVVGKQTRRRVRVLGSAAFFASGTYDQPPPAGPDTVRYKAPTTLLPGFETNNGQVTILSPDVQGTDGPAWVTTTAFYDDKGRTLQTQRTDPVSTTRTSTRYTFDGRTHASTTTHTRSDGVLVANGVSTLTIERRNAYDDQGRLKRTYQKNGPDAEIVVAEHRYNELGQRVETKMHSTDGGQTFAQTVTREWNVRGWSTTQTVTDGSGGGIYDQALKYTGGATPRYDGSVSRFEWDLHDGIGRHWYDYTYDGLGRLVDGTFGSTASSFERGNAHLSASYDLHGNLTTLRREGVVGTGCEGVTRPCDPVMSPRVIDNLSYSYAGEGNQLTNVTDESGEWKGFGQSRSYAAASDVAYTYDPNGNLLEDRHKGLSIAYTYLNVPDAVDFGDGRRIEWTWTATGEKLARVTLDDQGATAAKRYAGGFVYRDADGSGSGAETLDHFSHAGGRVRHYADTGVQAYQYAHTDHLGNTRVLYEPEGARVVQRASYYPYGLRIADLSSGSSTNEELYNGKELTASHGLDWYHYGARFYDVALARWTTMDPADQFHSPYSYVGGDPVNLVDPDGRQATCGAGGPLGPVSPGQCSSTSGKVTTPTAKALSAAQIVEGFAIATSSVAEYLDDTRHGLSLNTRTQTHGVYNALRGVSKGTRLIGNLAAGANIL